MRLSTFDYYMYNKYEYILLLYMNTNYNNIFLDNGA